jgi:hypothetical protein
MDKPFIEFGINKSNLLSQIKHPHALQFVHFMHSSCHVLESVDESVGKSNDKFCLRRELNSNNLDIPVWSYFVGKMTKIELFHNF